jgi:hypothetical protein
VELQREASTREIDVDSLVLTSEICELKHILRTRSLDAVLRIFICTVYSFYAELEDVIFLGSTWIILRLRI